jgi:hypothetical protein
MKCNLAGVAALIAGLTLSANALAATAVSPRLAPGVKAQAGYEALSERLVVANPTPIYSDIIWTSPHTGQLDKVGEPVNAIAKVKDWDWVLVGRDGVGIGYVSRDLLTTARQKPASGKRGAP